MYQHSSQQGYSIVEVLIAVTILMAAIVAPMTVAIKSIQSSQYALEQNSALFLAQESVSLLETLRNQQALDAFINGGTEFWDWTDEFDECRAPEGCNFDARDPYGLIDGTDIVACDGDGENCRLYYSEDWGRSAFRVEAPTGEETEYIRRVVVEELNNDELRVRVEVSWDSHFLGQSQQVVLHSSIYNIYENI